MPVSTIVVLVGVVTAFAIFASALAWAELQTRELGAGATETPEAASSKRRPF